MDPIEYAGDAASADTTAERALMRGYHYHVSAFGVILTILLVAFYFRSRLLPYAAPFLPRRVTDRLAHYQPLRTFTFADQAEAGMTSGNFDVRTDNLGLGEGSSSGGGSGENRIGLDEEAVEEVRRIMAINRCTFDQARLIRHNRILAKNGIAPDGTPLDAKAVTRL